MLRISLIFITLLGTATAAWSQAPTFHADIAPIIYQNCTECHRTGEIGPMPFTTYEEVSEYSSFISYVTATKYMPPWTPDPDYSTLRGERFLTEDEIELLAEWNEAGAPEGDPADNPGLPDFPEGSQVGEPDVVISMPSAYVHGGDMAEQYQVYVLETGVTEETEIRAVEIRPENGAIAHHALIGYTESPTSISEAEAWMRRRPRRATRALETMACRWRIFFSADGHLAWSLRFSLPPLGRKLVPTDGSCCKCTTGLPRWKSPI